MLHRTTHVFAGTHAHLSRKMFKSMMFVMLFNRPLSAPQRSKNNVQVDIACTSSQLPVHPAPFLPQCYASKIPNRHLFRADLVFAMHAPEMRQYPICGLCFGVLILTKSSRTARCQMSHATMIWLRYWGMILLSQASIAGLWCAWRAIGVVESRSIHVRGRKVSVCGYRHLAIQAPN